MGNQEGLGDAATPSRSLWGNSLAVYPTSSPVLEQRWARRLARRLSHIERHALALRLLLAIGVDLRQEGRTEMGNLGLDLLGRVGTLVDQHREEIGHQGHHDPTASFHRHAVCRHRVIEELREGFEERVGVGVLCQGIGQGPGRGKGGKRRLRARPGLAGQCCQRVRDEAVHIAHVVIALRTHEG